MQAEKTYAIETIDWRARIQDYSQMAKVKLNLGVVLSTVVGYIIGSRGGSFDWIGLFAVTLGGFLTVAAANGINQIIERDSDKLMKRTENRPLATNRIGVLEATIACTIMGLGGVLLIGLCLNTVSAMLSLISLCLYAFAYTPLKKITRLSVHIGAIPGAMPPIIGYVAASNQFDAFGGSLFLIQFLWQFPHFYSIAWILKKDYQLAGLKMSPLGADTEKNASIQIMLFSFVLVLASFLPWALGAFHPLTCILLAVVNGFIAWRSMELYKERTNKAAKKLMLACLLFLPASSLVLLLEKVL
jgi:protoheme IX farnesyltransferase